MTTLQHTHSLGHPGWWAIYARHQHEKAVADVLTIKGCDVFLPMYESVRQWKDRKKTIQLPLFPGYVFVSAVDRHRLPVLSTPGVNSILVCGEDLAVIPDAEIEGIRATLQGPFHVEPHPFLKQGDLVRVKSGALEGVVGVLVRRKNRCRLVLSVDMLAQSVAVEIDAADVEAMNIHDRPPHRSVQPGSDSRLEQASSA